ncbi:MAG: hypothetical protein AAGK78_11015 [Planctomycetota bacterium]
MLLRHEGSATPKAVWLWLTAILLLAVGVRFTLAQLTAAPLENLPDQVEYLQLAESLKAGNGLVLVDERYATPQTLRAQRMPGYPALVAAVGASIIAVQWLQFGLDVLTAVGVFVLGRRFVSPVAGLAAAGLVATHPFIAYVSTLLLSESAYTCLLTWSVVGLSHPTRARYHWLGLLAGVATVFVRPGGAVVTVAVVGAASLLPMGKVAWSPVARDSRWPLPPLVTAAGLIALCLLPWALRNRAILGQNVFLTTNAGITLFDGWNLDNTTGGSDQSFVGRMPQLGLMSEVDRDTYLRRQAWEDATRDPLRSVQLAGQKLARTWSPVPLSQFGDAKSLVAGLGYYAVFWTLLAVGLWLGQLRLREKMLLVLPILVLTALHVLTVGSMRYRLPAEPLLAVVAASGAMALIERRYGPAGEDADTEAGPAD